MDDEMMVAKGKRIIEIAWWALLLYMLAVFGWIYMDSRTNTEYYATADDLGDPSKLTLIGGYYVSQDGTKVPSWQYRASTASQCKPLTRISELWNTHGKIMLYIALMLTAFKLILDNLKVIRRLQDHIDDGEEKK